MPFKSQKQRRYLHANEPEIAQRWENEMPYGVGYGSKKSKAPKTMDKKHKQHQKAMANGLRKYGGNGSGATIGAAASG